MKKKFESPECEEIEVGGERVIAESCTLVSIQNCTCPDWALDVWTCHQEDPNDCPCADNFGCFTDLGEG